MPTKEELEAKFNNNDPVEHLHTEDSTDLPSSVESTEPPKNQPAGIGTLFVISMIVIFYVSIIALIAVGISIIRNDRDEAIEMIYVGEMDIHEMNPFDFNFWNTAMQIENHGIHLLVPVPPNAKAETSSSGNSAFLAQAEGDPYFIGYVTLWEMVQGDWTRLTTEMQLSMLQFFEQLGDILFDHVYVDDCSVLQVIHRCCECGSHKTSFVKISQYRGMLLTTTIIFDDFENREDYFKAFGFFDNFEPIIRSYLDDLIYYDDSTLQDLEDTADHLALY